MKVGTKAPATVLVVDDEPSVHGLLKAQLEERRYAVKTALRVEDAIAVLESAPIHAIVLDVRMPGRSGLDVLTYVRARPELRSLPVLILTGAAFTPEEEAIVTSHRAYVFYKQEKELDEFASYLGRLTSEHSRTLSEQDDPAM